MGQPPKRELQHAERRTIEPLDVVHRDERRSRGGVEAERSEHTQTDGALIQRVGDTQHQRSGQRLTLEEVALYTVKNDKITREQFFYAGEH